MPWTSRAELPERLKKATDQYSEEEMELWLEVANRCLERGADEGQCISAAHKAVELHRNSRPTRVVKNQDLGGEAPAEHEVMRVGIWLGHRQGVQVVTPERLRSALESFERHREQYGQDLVIDYDHQTSNAREKSGPGAPASGWIRDMELREDGNSLWSVDTAWTDQAEELIENGEYRYLSPVPSFNSPDRVTGAEVPMQLHSVGLVNNPFMTTIASLNSENGATEGAGETAREGIDNAGGSQMNLLELLASLRDQEPEQVAEELGLEAGADAEDEDVLQAMEAERSSAQSRVEELEEELEDQSESGADEEVLNALELDEDTDKRGVLTAIGRLQMQSDLSPVRNALDLDGEAGTDEMVEAIQELKEGETEARVTELVENAVESGKVPPAKKDYLLRLAETDEEAAREVINSLPGQTDLQGDDKQPGDGSTARLTDTEHAVAAKLGVPPEDMAEV